MIERIIAAEPPGKFSMNTRDRYALAAGILLGIISGALTVAAMFAAGLVFIACAILSPLIVSLVAQNRVMTLGQVPNLVMTITALIVFGAFVGFSSMPWRYGPGEISLGILTILVIAAIPALAVSGLVKFVRRKLRSESRM